MNLPRLSVTLIACCSLLLGGCSFWSVDQDVSKDAETSWKPPTKAYPKHNQKNTQGYEGMPMDLYGLLDLAVINSPSNRRSWQLAKESAALYGEARTLYLPSGGIVANSTGIQRSKNKYKVGNLDGYQTSYGVMLQLTWLLFDFGGRAATIAAAKEAMYSANFDFNQSLQDLALNVEISYFDLNTAQASVQANWSSLRDAYMALVAAEEKERSGLGDIQEVLRARANYQNAIYNLEQTGATVETARANLAATVGLRISSTVDIVPPGSPEDMLVVQEDVDTLLAKSMQDRPSLLAAYAAQRSKAEEVKAAKSAFFPELVVGASAQYLEKVNQSIDPEEHYRIGLGLQWNIFDVFTDRFKLLAAKAEERQALQNMRQAELDTMAQVWSYYYSFRSSIQQIQSARALVESSQEAFSAVRIGYSTGINNLLDLLNAQDTLASARLTLVQAESTFYTSLANLIHATGELNIKTRPEPRTQAS
mgnify:FL=1